MRLPASAEGPSPISVFHTGCFSLGERPYDQLGPPSKVPEGKSSQRGAQFLQAGSEQTSAEWFQRLAKQVMTLSLGNCTLNYTDTSKLYPSPSRQPKRYGKCWGRVSPALTLVCNSTDFFVCFFSSICVGEIDNKNYLQPGAKGI